MNLFPKCCTSLLNSWKTISTVFLVLLGKIEFAGCQNRVNFHFSSTDNVHFIATDPFGRKTGSDPRGASDRRLGIDIDEIPKATYGFEGPGDNPDTTSPQANPTYHVFMYSFASPQNDGTYTISIIGITTSSFEFYVSISANGGMNDNNFRYVAKSIPIEADSVINYILHFHSLPGSETTFEKVVNWYTLLQDIAAMRKLNWIKDQPTADKYAGLMSNYGRQVQEGDFANARITLTSVLQNISADSVSMLTVDACKLLRDDSQQLLNELPATISSLDPAFSLAAGGGFNLSVKGVSLVNGDKVNWNGSPRRTTFISTNELRASILASDVATAGTSLVDVKTPVGRVSNSLSFYVISAVNWVDTLISYKHRAVDLGWLKSKQDDDSDDDEKPDDGVVGNLDSRLDKVKKELRQEDFSKARKELEKFGKKLDRLRKRSEEAEKRNRPTQVVITIEGYDLLKTNTEYLTDRLPDGKSKKGSKDKD